MLTTFRLCLIIKLIKQKSEIKSLVGEEKMRKDKSIVAMFCVAVVALIASLSVTFGVLLTAADTTPVAGKQTVYSINMGYGLVEEGNVVNVNGQPNVMKINKTFTYQPKNTIEISNDYLLEDYVVPGQTAEELVEYVYTDAGNFMVIAFSVTNAGNYKNFDVSLEFDENADEQLKSSAKMSLYNYGTTRFSNATLNDAEEFLPELSVKDTITLNKITDGETAYYALVLYVPNTANMILNGQSFDFTIQVYGSRM